MTSEEIMTIAKDIGSHAEAEGWAAILRVLDTAPNQQAQMIAMTYVAAAQRVSIIATRSIIAEYAPPLLRIFDKFQDAAVEANG